MDIIPSFSAMWTKIANLNNTLFPMLQEVLEGPLSPNEEKLVRILDFAEIERFVEPVTITKTPKDRKEMARAFIAKSVYNFQTTRALIDRLRVDKRLRTICGWRHAHEIPSESKFSRVFEQFSTMRIAGKAHDAFIETYLKEIIFLHHSIDSTAIELREKIAKETQEAKEQEKEAQKNAAPKKRGRPKKGEERPKEPTLLERQSTMQTTKQMLELINTTCDIGTKRDAKGFKRSWRGGKLHLGVVDGDIPITMAYSSASTHDSSLALPIINDSSAKVSYLYDLADAAYDATIIKDFSQRRHHRPIIDINPKNSATLKAKIVTDKEERKRLGKLKFFAGSDRYHYNQRSSVERVNAYLKDNFGCNTIYYRGANKVASVLAFAVLSVCIHQSLKLIN